MSAIKQYYSYTVINFDTLIDKVNVDVVNYYFDNGIPLTKINRDFKKIFVHCLIKDLCAKCLVLESAANKILFCNPYLVSPRSELFDSVSYESYILFLQGVLKELRDLIPVAIYFSIEKHFCDISEKELTNDLRYEFDFAHAKTRSSKSLKRLSEYADQMGLNFLRKDYLKYPKFHKLFI